MRMFENILAAFEDRNLTAYDGQVSGMSVKVWVFGYRGLK
jgi:hypothetical protein